MTADLTWHHPTAVTSIHLHMRIHSTRNHCIWVTFTTRHLGSLCLRSTEMQLCPTPCPTLPLPSPCCSPIHGFLQRHTLHCLSSDLFVVLLEWKLCIPILPPALHNNTCLCSVQLDPCCLNHLFTCEKLMHKATSPMPSAMQSVPCCCTPLLKSLTLPLP